MDKEYLIEKWLNGELTNSEKDAFVKLDDFEFNNEIINAAKQFKASYFSEVDDFSTFKKHINKKTKSKNWIKPLIRIAAVVVISLGLYFTVFNNNTTQIITLASQKITTDLPDGSIVTLNVLSELSFDEKNWEDFRQVKLKGEAYFKVAKGKKFDVFTTDGMVTVVGTEFNVKQRKDYFEVKCFEGIVKVSSDTIIRQLLAGDTYKILNGKFTQSKTAQTKPYWTENMSLFESIPYIEILAELERQYNIEVTYENANVNRLFTGGFVHENLENALISITQPMNLTYKINSSNDVIIYGNKD